MKKFFYFSVIALCFAACKPVEPTDETPIFTLKILQNGVLIPITNDTTVIIEEFEVMEDGDIEFTFEGTIFPEEEFNLEVTTTRNDFAVQNHTFDKLCLIQCENAQFYDEDGEWVFPVTVNFNSKIKSEKPQTFEAHCLPAVEGDHIIIYDFHEQENPNAKIKVTVIYRYRN